MKQQGCERITVNVGPQNAPEMRDVCDFCAEDWNTENDTCSVIDSAARIAYDLGRRDAERNYRTLP